MPHMNVKIMSTIVKKIKNCVRSLMAFKIIVTSSDMLLKILSHDKVFNPAKSNTALKSKTFNCEAEASIASVA